MGVVEFKISHSEQCNCNVFGGGSNHFTGQIICILQWQDEGNYYSIPKSFLLILNSINDELSFAIGN